MLTEGTLFPNLGRLTPAEVSRLNIQEKALLRVSAGMLTFNDILSMRNGMDVASADQVLLAVSQ